MATSVATNSGSRHNMNGKISRITIRRTKRHSPRLAFGYAEAGSVAYYSKRVSSAHDLNRMPRSRCLFMRRILTRTESEGGGLALAYASD